MSGRPNGNANETELVQRGDSVGQSNLFDDFPSLKLDSAHAAEPHLAVRSIGKSAHDEIVKGRPRVGACAHPTEHDHVTIGDETGCSFKAEIGTSLPKIRHECLERHRPDAR